MGTPRDSANCTASLASLCIRPTEKPKSKRRLSTQRGNLSSVAVLRPLPELMTAIIVSASRPALAPIASASDVMATAVADRMLLTSFIAWPWPGSAPTQNILPMTSTIGRNVSARSFGQATITATVPFSAPVGPPLTGASTAAMPFAASVAATSLAATGPVVDRSMKVFTLAPVATSAATFLTMSGVGRLASTVVADAATSAGEAARLAPRCTRRATLVSLRSKTVTP